MHFSQRQHMALSIKRYMSTATHFTVVDLGSRNANDSLPTHEDLLTEHDVDYIGIDLMPGPNVDLVMPKPYTFPIASRSVDFVLSGAVFEHVPFPWASVLEIGRVLKPGGYAFITVPSRGHQHNVYDCWRYYPDSFRALAAWSRLNVVEIFYDAPPLVSGLDHHDYAAIDTKHSYWGDTVAVLRKPKRGYPELRMAALRKVIQAVANRTTELPATRGVVDRERERAHKW